MIKTTRDHPGGTVHGHSCIAFLTLLSPKGK